MVQYMFLYILRLLTQHVPNLIRRDLIILEIHFPTLRDILPKNFARPELDKRRLGDVVDLFTNVQMADGADEKDLLGRTYEYCLRNFAEQEGKNAGLLSEGIALTTAMSIVTLPLAAFFLMHWYGIG